MVKTDSVPVHTRSYDGGGGDPTGNFRIELGEEIGE